MRAEWRIKGIYKADAQKVADEIGDKKVTPQEILEKARDETSELHKCFEWDDSVAKRTIPITTSRKCIEDVGICSKNKRGTASAMFSHNYGEKYISADTAIPCSRKRVSESFEKGIE